MSTWTLILAGALTAGLALVLAFPDRCRTTATANRMLTVAGRWTLNTLLVLWVLATWRRVTRNLGIAYTDKHAVKRTRTVDRRGVMTEKEHPKITYPHLVARPDAHGVVLTVWTRVGIGRKEFEDATGHLANVWRCRRVHVEQHTPGRITVRGLRRDPLASRLSLPLQEPAQEPPHGPLHAVPEVEEGDEHDAAAPHRAA